MRGRTKQNGRTHCISPPACQSSKWSRLLCRHFDAAQFQRFAFHRALYGHVMAGVFRYLVLRVDHVHLLVGVVHEHVLGVMLLDALTVHSAVPALSFAPFTPHWLSEIQPVKELSAAIASVPAKSVAAIAVESLSFICSPSRSSICGG